MGLVDTIIGHNKEKQILLNALKKDRLATTYLFCGESGIGKRTFALEFAKVLNCEHPTAESDSCDHCSCCRKISSNNHPDLFVVAPESNVIRIEAIREVQEFLSLAPYEGRKKIVIIDDAHLMNQPASNAFLKTLEEPAANSLIILISNLPELLLETIRSRCFRLNFALLNEEETIQVLKRHLGIIEEEMLRALARLCMGRPGIFGGAEYEEIMGEFDNIAGALETKKVSDRVTDRTELEHWIERITIIFRDILLTMVHPHLKDALIVDSLQGFYNRISKKLDIDSIIKLYTRLTDLKRSLRFNINLSIARNYIESKLNEHY
ncbi:MAG: DNA polymerase III subunit delta' [Nitrospirae bacterium]|nr:DNA polymerase III subunit delta' [Nitrospirota bacterium]